MFRGLGGCLEHLVDFSLPLLHPPTSTTPPQTHTSPCTTPWRQHYSTIPTYTFMHCSTTGVISATVSFLTPSSLQPHCTRLRLPVRMLTVQSAAQMSRMPDSRDHHSSFSWYLTVQLAHAFIVRGVREVSNDNPQPYFRSTHSDLFAGDAARDHPRCCK